jgi:thiamine-monophosphate kinase
VRLMKRTTEKELIAKIQRAFRANGKRALGLPLGDDAAVVRPRPGYQAILTCDWMLEGSHFFEGKHPPYAVGWKSLARAASDIAATGGVPRYFLLSLAIPERLAKKWLDDFLLGLRQAASRFDCKLAGGDSTCRDQILISVTVIGEIAEGLAIGRSGARPGDKLFVTGTLGEAALGLNLLRSAPRLADPKNPALRAHLQPEPRLAVGQWLATNGLATAMMDISDGLSSDLPRLCEASGVGAKVVAEQLPISSLAAREDALSLALDGGDDYELLFAVRGDKVGRIPREYGGISLTQIGEVTVQKKILIEQAGKAKLLLAGGWDPFGE